MSDNGLSGYGVATMAVDPMTPTTLYVETYGGGVFRSTDGGGSWTAINAGLDRLDISIWTIVVDRMTPTNVYAGTSGDGAFVLR